MGMTSSGQICPEFGVLQAAIPFGCLVRQGQDTQIASRKDRTGDGKNVKNEQDYWVVDSWAKFRIASLDSYKLKAPQIRNACLGP